MSDFCPRGNRAMLSVTLLAVLAVGACDKIDQFRTSHPVAKIASAAPVDTFSVHAMTDSNIVTVIARDYSFEVPDQLPAGFTTFRLENHGTHVHNVQLLRFRDGKNVNDLITSVLAGYPRPSWAEYAGGPNLAAPGSVTQASFVLEPGDYAFTCLITGDDGQPHIVKGMAYPVTVVPRYAVPAMPHADLKVTLVEYGFDVAQPISAGNHVIAVHNAGTQPHELLVLRLAPGKRAADYISWYARQDGPPPGELVGGVTSIQPGKDAIVQANLPAGTYALFCLIPDAKDGRSHVAHGMIREINVGGGVTD